jgi:biopolymer transport protein ExbD
MKLKSRNKVSASFSMSSMTDLVFLLLIFFIIVSTMVTQHLLDMNLPSGNVTADVPALKIVVEIDAALQHVVDGTAVPIEELGPAMTTAFANQANPDSAKKSVVLFVDKTVDAENLVNVLLIAKQNGWGLAIATDPG